MDALSRWLLRPTLGVRTATTAGHAAGQIVRHRDALLRERDAALAAERAARALAERQANELGALVEVARAISGKLSTEDVLVEVQAQLTRVLAFDSYFVALRDPDSADPAVRYAVVFDGGQRYLAQEGAVALRPTGAPGPSQYASRVMLTGEPLLVLRTPEQLQELESGRPGEPAAQAGALGDTQRRSASLLYAPLRTGDTVFGVLSVQSYRRDAYAPHHLALVDAVARQVAVALQNARLAGKVGEADALRSLSQMKDQLIATVSHELRTPLTYIYGYSELLSAGGLAPDRAVRVAGEIHQAATHMRHILDDVLDAERLQAGALVLDAEPVDLATLVDEAVRLLAARAAQHTLVVDLPGDLPLLLADHHRVVQVLVNVVENALRYSPPGTTIQVGAATRDAWRAVIWVQDQGAGLTAEQQERVFEKFYRGPLEVTAGHPGAGLGLAICRGLVEAHGRGCRIWAESDGPGLGSRFAFTLPIAATARPFPAVPAPPAPGTSATAPAR